MEQNNFEKDIQQKMGELKIAASDSAWPNIEKNISKKNIKRIAIFIIIIVLLFLSFGGFWFINSKSNNQQKNDAIAGIVKKGSKPTNNPDSFLKQKIIDNVISSKAGTSKIIAGNSKIKSNPSKKNTISSKKLTVNYSRNKSTSSKPTKIEESYFDAVNKSSSSVKQDIIAEKYFKKETENLPKEIKNDSLKDEHKLQKI